MSATQGFEVLTEFPVDPADGLRIQDFDSGTAIRLRLERLEGGVPVPLRDGRLDRLLWSCEQPEAADHVLRRLLESVLTALVRYYGCGGTLPQVQAALDALAIDLPGQLQIPGHTLYDAYVDSEGQFVSLWQVDGLDNYVRWVEDSFVESGLTLVQIQQEIEAGGADPRDLRSQTGLRLEGPVGDDDDGVP